MIHSPQQLAVLRRQLKKENAKWGAALVEVPLHSWPAQRPLPGNYRRSVWRSRDFIVQVFEEYQGAVRITVNRTELAELGTSRDGISWDDLQRIKRECGFGEEVAMELYPPDASVVNVGAMRHLFVVPKAPAFMWRDRSADDDLEAAG